VKCECISHSPYIAKEQNAKHSITKRKTERKYVIDVTVNVMRNQAKTILSVEQELHQFFSKENHLLKFEGRVYT